MDGFTAAQCEACDCMSASRFTGCPEAECCGGGRCKSYCSWIFSEEDDNVDIEEPEV
jgi:hypothetical protein